MRKAKKIKLLPLVHPGEILAEEFLKPLGVSGYKLSKAIGVTPILKLDLSQLFQKFALFLLGEVFLRRR